MNTTGPLMCFYGDDFTGSTDALESLWLAGLSTTLFSQAPTRRRLAEHPGLQAFGVAGMSRAMTPEHMETELRPVLTSLRDTGVPIVHYKICSTFDSSPAVGSIGKVIEIGLDVFGDAPIPIVAGAPSLGRYCLFGNLFARLGADGPVYRLDRHPSMSKHPITPMDEADLRLHMAKQTDATIGLVTSAQLALDADAAFATNIDDGAKAILIDLDHEG
ncbi:MAG: four-carbon acid sugar kinase family protein, partial [Vicinamibacterales bacterium]